MGAGNAKFYATQEDVVSALGLYYDVQSVSVRAAVHRLGHYGAEEANQTEFAPEKIMATNVHPGVGTILNLPPPKNHSP